MEIGRKVPVLVAVWQMCVQTLYTIEIQKRVKPKFLAVLPKSIFIFEKKKKMKQVFKADVIIMLIP